MYRGRVYAVNDNGVLQVADARTGAEVYKARVGGGGRTFSSSPLASQGRVYLLSEDGEAFVLRAGDRYDEIAANALGEMSLASPAADADSLYVRTQTKLYRLARRRRSSTIAQGAAAVPRPSRCRRQVCRCPGGASGVARHLDAQNDRPEAKSRRAPNGSSRRPSAWAASSTPCPIASTSATGSISRRSRRCPTC